MLRVLLLTVLAASLLYFIPFLNGESKLITPITQNKSDKQELLDEQIFNEVKNKVKADKIGWANGKGKLHEVVDGSSYIVVNKNGEVVFSKNPDTKKSPASLAKLMTAIIVLDLVPLSHVFTVPKEATGLEPTILIADEGEKFTVNELLNATLIVSANDAAETLAWGVSKNLGGSRELFIKLMNEKAKNLGLTKTNFENPTGYDDPNQFSTARDLAKLAHYAQTTYPAISEIVKTKTASIAKTKNHKKYELPNWNSLLGVYPGVDGVKIGFTDEAGHVTMVTSDRENENFTVVFFGAPDRRARDLWASELLNSAFQLKGIKPFRVTVDMLIAKSNEWSEQLTKAQDEKAPTYNSPIE